MVSFSPFKKSPKKQRHPTPPTSPSHAEIFQQALGKRRKASSESNARLARTSGENNNFITRRKFFKNAAKRVFYDLDADGSGELDGEELYNGVLMMHLNLAKVFGSAACKPPTREVVQNLFTDFDDDHSGSLNFDEFLSMCVLLMGEVLVRVVFQWLFTLVVSPFIGEFMLRVWSKFYCFLVGRIGFFSMLDTVSNYAMVDRVLSFAPATLPLTLMSCIAACIIVPFVLNTIDNYFAEKAESFHQAQKAKKR